MTEENAEEQKKNLDEEPDKEEARFKQFFSTAIRAPKAGSFEHFLTQSLAQTILMTDVLKRTKTVTESALMIPETDRENLAIDYEKVNVLNLVANALLNPSIRKCPEDMEVVSIPWGFPQTEENYKAFILPWYNCKPFFWPGLLVKHGKTWRVWHCQKCTIEVLKAKRPFPDTLRFPEKCPKCHNTIVNPYNGFAYVTTFDQTNINREPYWSFFFEISTDLTPEGYDLLRNNFGAWATPQIQLFLAELSRMVDPSLYAEIVGLYTSKHGKKGYSEKVKEASEIPKDENRLAEGS
jgi:hypothetical protein